MEHAAKRFKVEEQDIAPSVSNSIPNLESSAGSNIADSFLALEKQLNDQLNQLSVLTNSPKVSVVYKPLEYAYETHSYFVRKYLTGTKEVLFVGMNPGPFGMAQTGVPFGEVSSVRDWLQIKGTVGKPALEHPKRKVLGFQCTRNEVTGKRFWNFFKDLCHTPEQFFRYSFVHNYCPLVFMADNGKNVTPPSLSCNERKPLHQMCDKHICDTVRLLQTRIVIAIGKYAYERIKEALERDNISGVRVEMIMHPSPINPAANKCWNSSVMTKLQELDLIHYFVPQ